MERDSECAVVVARRIKGEASLFSKIFPFYSQRFLFSFIFLFPSVAHFIILEEEEEPEEKIESQQKRSQAKKKK